MEVMVANAAGGAAGEPVKHTTSPIVTGTSVLGVKYAGGVMMCADTLGSYGGLARFFDLERIRKVGTDTLIGAGGEYSDFQELMHKLDEHIVVERCHDDGSTSDAKSFYNYIGRLFYAKRNKMNPFWNQVLVGGCRGGKSFLGYIDKLGTMFEGDFLATGYGGHLAIPILRERWVEGMSEADARKLLEDCMRVLYYRDCRTTNKIMFATASAAGLATFPPIALETKWDYAMFIKPKAGADTDGSW